MTDFSNDFPCEKQVSEHFYLDFWRLYIGEGGVRGGGGGVWREGGGDNGNLQKVTSQKVTTFGYSFYDKR